MKRSLFYLLLVICLLFGVAGIAGAESDLKMQAINDLQKAVIKALPSEGKIIRIAIMDFENDDGSIRNAITSAITEKTAYKVIERTDLDVILKEQGMQLKDIMDEKSRIQHGKIKGVQGVIMGKVLNRESGFMSYAIHIQMKLDDVEKGEVIFSKNLEGKAVSPLRTWMIGIALGIVAIIIFFLLRARRTVVVKEEKIVEDVREREDLASHVKKALSCVADAKDHLMKKGKTETAIELKDLERELIYLKEQVENAARGSVDLRSKAELQEALETDRRNKDYFVNVAQNADRLYETALVENMGQLERDIASLKRSVKTAVNEFKERKI